MILPIIHVENNKEIEGISFELKNLIEKELKINLNISTMEIIYIIFGISIENKMNYYRYNIFLLYF